jgi:glycosyltransferase involved in cell wall biosynthesis
MNKRLKILISAYACNPLAPADSYPGEDIVGWNLVRELAKFYKLTAITRSYNKTNIEKVLRTDSLKNIEFHYIELSKIFKILKKNYFGIRIYYWFWQIKAYLVAKRLIKKQKFDIAHQVTFNNDWTPSYIGAYLNIPFIWGPAGGGQKVPRAFVGELRLKNRFKEITRSVFQEFWRYTPTRIIGMKKAKAVLVCNDETRKKVERFNKNVYHFPVNGISRRDVEFRGSSLEFSAHTNFSNRETKKNSLPKHQTLNTKLSYPRSISPKFKVLTSGRFTYWKAFHLAVKAFAKFHRKFPASEFEIVGFGTEKLRIKEIIKRHNLENCVKLTPWLPRSEVLNKMRKSHVFLYASLREGGGAVIVEAMASGLPVICLDLAGPGFHIKSEWGIKIKPENPGYVVEEMAKALEKLYLDDKLRIQMGINARKRAKEYYLWEHLGERLQEIYKEVLHIRD